MHWYKNLGSQILHSQNRRLLAIILIDQCTAVGKYLGKTSEATKESPAQILARSNHKAFPGSQANAQPLRHTGQAGKHFLEDLLFKLISEGRRMERRFQMKKKAQAKSSSQKRRCFFGWINFEKTIKSGLWQGKRLRIKIQ